MHKLLELVGTFRRDQRGNMALTFAACSVVLLMFVGSAVDYSRASQIQAKLQAAADAASVGSVARNSPAYIYAGTMTSDGSIAVGVTDATNIFNANIHNLPAVTINSLTPVVQKTGSAVTASVT
jgi:Flp pilus assembly protein TadG